jgi:glycosyltransferase involved in cell wall biosynthesis
MYSAALVGGTTHREYLLELGFDAGRIFLGYDVVDNQHFSDFAEAARIDPGRRSELGLPDRYFFACSRFSQKKNVLGLIREYSEYRRLCVSNPWQLVIAGDGELRPDIERERHRLALNAHVILLGAVGYQSIPAYYGLASAFVHASTSEQWGLVVNEALAAGLPVLVSERCGCAEELVIDGENGFCFDPSIEGKLSQLMLCTAQMDLSTMGMRSREVIARWGPSAFAMNLHAACAAALRAGPPQPGVIQRLSLYA